MLDEPGDTPLLSAEVCGSSIMSQEKYLLMGPMFLSLTLLILLTFGFSRVFVRYFKKRRVPVFPERKGEPFVPSLAKDPCETAKPDCNDDEMQLAHNDRDVAKRLGPSQQKVKYKWTIPLRDRKRIDQLLLDLLSVEDLCGISDRGFRRTPSFAGNWAPILQELFSEAHRRYPLPETKGQELIANIEDQILISMREDSTNESNGQIEYAYCQPTGNDMGDRYHAGIEPFIEEISCFPVEENEAAVKGPIHEEHVEVSEGVPSQGLSTENERESNMIPNTESQGNFEVPEVTTSCETPKANSGSPSLKTAKSTSWKLDKRPSLSSLSSASSTIGEAETPKLRDRKLSEKTRIREAEPNVKGRRKDRRKDSKQRTAVILQPPAPAPPPGFLKPPPQDWVAPSPTSPKPLVAPPPGFGLLKPYQLPPPGLNPPKRHLRANAPAFTPRFDFPLPDIPGFPELSSDATCDSISRTERSSTAASGCSSTTLSFDDHPFMVQSDEMHNLVSSGSRGTPIDDGHEADDELDSYYYEEGRPSVDLSFLES